MFRSCNIFSSFLFAVTFFGKLPNSVLSLDYPSSNAQYDLKYCLSGLYFVSEQECREACECQGLGKCEEQITFNGRQWLCRDPNKPCPYGVEYRNEKECIVFCKDCKEGVCQKSVYKKRYNKGNPGHQYYCYGSCVKPTAKFVSLEDCESNCLCQRGVCNLNIIGQYFCDQSGCVPDTIFKDLSTCLAACPCATHDCSTEEDGKSYQCFDQKKCIFKKKFSSMESCTRRCRCSDGRCEPTIPDNKTFECFRNDCIFEKRYTTLDLCRNSKNCDCRLGQCVRRKNSPNGFDAACEEIRDNAYCDHESTFTSAEECGQSCTCPSGSCTGSGVSYTCTPTNCNYTGLFESLLDCRLTCSCPDSRCALVDEAFGVFDVFKCQKIEELKKLEVECDYHKSFDRKEDCDKVCHCTHGECVHMSIPTSDSAYNRERYQCRAKCNQRFEFDFDPKKQNTQGFCGEHCQCPYPTFCAQKLTYIKTIKKSISKWTCLTCESQYGKTFYHVQACGRACRCGKCEQLPGGDQNFVKYDRYKCVAP